MLTVVLYLFFRRFRAGIAMRGVVDNPALLSLTGESPVRVRRWAWLIGSVFASLSGLMLAPALSLDALIITMLVVQAFGAAAVRQQLIRRRIGEVRGLRVRTDGRRRHGARASAFAALDLDEVKALHRGLRRALEQGIARQGSTLRDYRLPDGGSGGMQHEFKVYGRGGEPCERCGTPIDKIRVAGRGTWYCPSCQRQRRASAYAARSSSSRPSRSRRHSSV